MPILSGHARIAGIIGWPVSHSRSPRLHGFWLERYQLDGAYIPLPIEPLDFGGAVRGLVACGFAGANVTIPHKLAAFEVCDAVDDTARRAGAVNTLVFKDGRISGSNTDGWGFIANVRHHGIDPLPDSALLLGAGGSTRAIAAALQAAGVSVTIANRTRERAVRLAADLPGIRVVEWAARSEALANHGMLVNTTSLGMAGHGPVDIDLNRARPDLVVADIVYVPMETGLLAAARARGLRCVGGLGLLLFQAIPGFRAWFGAEPSVDVDLERFVAADLMPK